MLIRKVSPKKKKKKKITKYFKTWPKTKAKISFGFARKNPNFEKYIDFKPLFIHHIAHVTAKMRCGAVMILAKL